MRVCKAVTQVKGDGRENIGCQVGGEASSNLHELGSFVEHFELSPSTPKAVPPPFILLLAFPRVFLPPSHFLVSFPLS
jgi:hypothetical protein